MNINDMPRRFVRYWLFRFRNEALGKEPANGAPPGLKKHFEGQQLFTGWENFAVNWDIPEGEPSDVVSLEAIRRYRSVWDEWDDSLRSYTDDRIVPVKGR